jgi:hypothetical protein
MNTYQYVGSNPINGLDPLGLANIPNEKCQKQCDQIAAEAKKRGVAPGVIATYLNNCYICCGTKEDNDTCAGSIPIAPKKPVGPRPKPRCYCAANDCAPNE